MKKEVQPRRIVALGFDKLGFICPPSECEEDGYTLKFVEYQSTCRLGPADGIIFPSGIFEKIVDFHKGLYSTRTEYVADVHLMAARKKELLNHLEDGGWICTLLRDVQYGDHNQWADTDLAKEILNWFFHEVLAHDPVADLRCKSDEFREYFKDFGIGRTSLGGQKGKSHARILAQSAGRVFAAEVEGLFFFLPLPVVEPDQKILLHFTKLAVEGILSYKKRNDLYLPRWVEEINFESELKTSSKIKVLEEQLFQARNELNTYTRYKGILSTSGKLLNTIVVDILRDFFGINLRSQEAYIEDACVYDKADNLLFVVEIKGVNGGIKRDHINQVDSHRERLGIHPDVPGLLIINDFLDVDGKEERKKKPIDLQHIIHARKLNVRILRTTTLVELMLKFESNDGRGTYLIECCNSADPIVEIEKSASD